LLKLKRNQEEEKTKYIQKLDIFIYLEKKNNLKPFQTNKQTRQKERESLIHYFLFVVVGIVVVVVVIVYSSRNIYIYIDIYMI
jgi:hypothetical protein